LAGVVIANLCTAFILGTSTPCVVDCISRREEAFGVVVPMPTLFCACTAAVNRKKHPAKDKIFFIRSGLDSTFVAAYKNSRIVSKCK
jgi:hypothetical protein